MTHGDCLQGALVPEGYQDVFPLDQDWLQLKSGGNEQNELLWMIERVVHPHRDSKYTLDAQTQEILQDYLRQLERLLCGAYATGAS
jgi:hypothetical protein